MYFVYLKLCGVALRLAQQRRPQGSILESAPAVCYFILFFSKTIGCLCAVQDQYYIFPFLRK